MPTINIDDLVQRILSDLVPAPIPTPTPVVSQTQPTPVDTTSQEPTPQSNALKIESRVITLAQIDKVSLGQNRTFDRIIVPPKAVITPSVRDELRKRNITIEHGVMDAANTVNDAKVSCSPVANPVTSIAVAPSGTLHVWLALHALKQEPKPLLEFLSRQYRLQNESFQCILKTMEAAYEQLEFSGEPTSCVVLTPASAAAMCVANRQNDTIRAVLGHDPSVLKSDAEQIGANLLVVDPIRTGTFKTQNLVKMFLSDGVRKVPSFLFS